MGCFKPMRSAVPLASDITKTLIKLLCSFGKCLLCDSPFSKAGGASVCHRLTGGSFLKDGKGQN